MACGDPVVGHEGQVWVSALWSGAILSARRPHQVRQGVGPMLLPLLHLGSSVWKFKERIQCGDQMGTIVRQALGESSWFVAVLNPSFCFLFHMDVNIVGCVCCCLLLSLKASVVAGG